jgi:hypothetical protein
MQTATGGVLQLTPAQGSPVHWPLVVSQPKEHVVCVSA